MQQKQENRKNPSKKQNVLEKCEDEIMRETPVNKYGDKSENKPLEKTTK